MSVYSELTKVFDAVFNPKAFERHWETHKHGSNTGKTELPKQMTKSGYAKKAEKLSMMKIDGKKVRAYKYSGNRIAKTDGQWFVSYADGQRDGNITTCFPAGYEYFEKSMKEKHGKEIFSE